MSKKIYFILFITCFFFDSPFCFTQNTQKKAAKLLEEAEHAFSEKEYTLALKKYESALESGYFTQKSLHRLAMLSELQEAPVAAYYYFRRLWILSGKEKVKEKTIQLARSQGISVSAALDNQDRYERFWNRWNGILWLLLVASGLLFSFALLFRKWPFLQHSATQIGLGAILVMVLGLHFHRAFLSPERAIIASQALFYTHPSYAAQALTEPPFLPGTTVIIRDRVDLWYKIETDGKSAWVPQQSLFLL